MVAKLPPPPPIASRDPALNRWMVEITAILAASGGLDPTQIPGYAALQAQSAANAAAITTLNGEITTLNGEVATNTANIATNTANIATNTASIATLTGRAQVLNGVGAPAAGLGNVNDWYANVGGAVGARIYVKTAVGTWTPFPF
jgi:hypothetical protein